MNDATDFSKALTDFGFDVITLINASKAEMIKSIDQFGVKIRNAEASLFYYAGHGMQVEGQNYLIPVKSNINTQSDIEFEAVAVGRILGKMEDARCKVNIVFLDACRNNPFARSFRSSSRGLAKIDAPTGTFIAFATAPGSVAADGNGDNGIFTYHLLNQIKKPDLKIEDILKKVRKNVISETDNSQVPWQSSSLVGDFYFDRKNPIVISNDIKDVSTLKAPSNDSPIDYSMWLIFLFALISIVVFLSLLRIKF